VTFRSISLDSIGERISFDTRTSYRARPASAAMPSEQRTRLQPGHEASRPVIAPHVRSWARQKRRATNGFMTTINDTLTTLADRPLLDEAKRLAAHERRATAALLRALMEIDSRRLYLGEGCASMFTYCTQVLHLAEGAAYNRIEAARAAARFPLILDLVQASAITLTAVRLLSPHLTADNHGAVLASAQHKSKPDVLAIIAALSPRPDAPFIVRKLSAGNDPPPLLSRASDHASPATLPAGAPSHSTPVKAPAAPTVTASTFVAVPLAPDRYRIQLTVTGDTHDKFRRAQDLLRHALPGGDAAAVLDRALTLLIADLERTRFAAASRPRPAPKSASARRIPAAVRRAVSKRDEERCRFIGTSGRCRETTFLKFHHVTPFAAGGAATVDNIELRCRAHNLYEARLFFGDSIVREERAAWTAPAWNSFRNEAGRLSDAGLFKSGGRLKASANTRAARADKCGWRQP
jgi:hypothetical protein